MIWDYGAGNFTTVDGTIYVEDSGGAVSQNAVGNDWVIPWTSPAEDVGDINFALAGNIVDGSENADAGDHWTTLSFMISAPGTSTPDEDSNLRTISVGDYDSLFGQKTAEEIEAERQADIADGYFTQGNLYFWTTLSIIIVAAVIQGEFYERKFGGGPPHLDRSLAVPQGIRRGVLVIGIAIGLGWGIDSELPWGYNLVIAMLMLWSIFGVYRTVVQARAEANQKTRYDNMNDLHLPSDVKDSFQSHLEELFRRISTIVVLVVILTGIWSLSIDQILNHLLTKLDPCDGSCVNIFSPEEWAGTRWLSAGLLAIFTWRFYHNANLFIWEKWFIAK